MVAAPLATLHCEVRRISRASRCLPSLFLAIGGSLIFSPAAAADPTYINGSAQSVIDELRANGYNVVINWLTGYDTKSLSVCWVSNINNPGEWNPPPGVFTTVYVDVSCPNHDYD
jgi:hypothetical protein